MMTGAVGTADLLSRTDAEAVARRLAPLRLAAAARVQRRPAEPPTSACPSCSASATRRPSTWPRAGHPARTGTGCGCRSASAADGQPVELDLKESAQDGMGPHGLLIGATGSGKSELLRTLVLALAATHSSEALNFVLVDFKGGATFASLDRLPHTAAVITNLADELPLVDRMVDAINGELVRRQELLRRAGNFASAYATTRRPGRAAHPSRRCPVAADHLRRVLRAAHRQAGLHRPVRPDRTGRPVARRPPAARLAAAGGGPAARPGHPPVVPDRPADLLRAGVADGARRARRVRVAPQPRPRVPEIRHRAAGAVQGGVRLRPVPASRRGDHGRWAPDRRAGARLQYPLRAGPGAAVGGRRAGRRG